MLDTALAHFNDDIGRAQVLLAHATPMADGTLKDDILRAAWMMSVGACDAYFSDAYADLVSRTLQAKALYPTMAIPTRMNNLRLPVVAVIRGREDGWRWRMAARELIENENVLSIKKIKDLFNQFFPDSNKLFSAASMESWILHRSGRSRYFGITPTAYRALASSAKGAAKTKALNKLEDYYEGVFQRRHDCIHNCDRPKMALQRIAVTTVTKRIEDCRFLVSRCHEELTAAFPLYLKRCGCTGQVMARVGSPLTRRPRPA